MKDVRLRRRDGEVVGTIDVPEPAPLLVSHAGYWFVWDTAGRYDEVEPYFAWMQSRVDYDPQWDGG